MGGERSYLERESDRLAIASEGYVHALGRAEAIGAAALWVHTHPGTCAIPMPSEHDAIVDRELTDVFRLRSGSDYYGTLILSPREAGIAFSGRLQDGSGDLWTIERLWSVGERFTMTRAWDGRSKSLSAAFDRNIRAFGGDLQRVLGDLSVGIVGCGGTGSCVAEQLVRLGVRHITLVDPDSLSDSNITRVYRVICV